MSSSHVTELCAEVEESLADILDGSAPARLVDHLAECDACRDRRYEAERTALAIEQAGGDFRPSDDFAERMLERVFAARPGAPQSPSSTAQAAVRQSGEVERALPSQDIAPTSEAKRIVATAPTEFAPSSLERGGGVDIDMNRTTFDPAPRGAVEEADAPSFGPNKTIVLKDDAKTLLAKEANAEGEPSASASSTSARSEKASAREVRYLTPGGRREPIVEAVTGKNDTGSDPAKTTEDTLASGAGRPRDRASRRATIEAGPAAVSATADGANATGDKFDRRNIKPAKTDGSSGGGAIVRLFKKPLFVGPLVAAMAAAAVGGIYLFKKTPPTNNAPTAFVDGAWSGSVAWSARASDDGQSGLEICTGDRADKCTPLAKNGAIAPGSTVRTDAKTRARLTLVDGTVLALDRSSEVSLAGGASREAKITRGLVVADVAKADKAVPAKFDVPQGLVEMIDPKTDAKLSITTTDRRSAVEVARSEVKVSSPTGEAANVRAGEEADMTGTGVPAVGAKHTMSDNLEWSDQSQEDVDGTLKGIGELRAKKPGETQEKDHAVRLSKHEVKVRVVDVVARTEVDETFTNDTGDQLEGIYRFPLPPDADIEKLSLEVDGKLVDGAFVDRDKGAAIWRGAIQQAAPQIKQTQEIIWVPGPWRDPALLEWQRGGQFELHIFPIPAHGSRRVVLSYTQKVPQAGGIRHYSYPLGLDAKATNKIDDFGIDFQVLGLDKEFGVTTRGYQLVASGGPSDGAHLVMNEKNFIPAGDLTVEYALPDRDKELTAWAYQMDMTGQAAPLPQAMNAPSSSWNGVTKSKAQRETEAKANARNLSDDQSPFVAISLRPKLPRWGEGHERLDVIVVDSSRSMIGERFSRATRLAASMVREMDRRDSFMLLACDTTCQIMGAAPGAASPAAREPSTAAADDVERFLGSIEPDGGSNLFTAMQDARTAAGNLGGKELRVIYLGDGTPTVGPTKTSTVEAAVRQALPSGDGSLVAVALGTDADTTTLAAMARAGGGVMVPYVPGQRVSAAAVDVLAATYDSELSDVRVDLPPGLTGVTPTAMDSIPAGGEAFVYARMTGSAAHGNVVLRGRVHGQPFEASYPADIAASTSAGNAFVPRLFAAAKIADLERQGRVEDKEAIIALSQRFAVASRYTSLLVLESDAMFKAFGLDRNAIDAGFSGETGATSTTSDSTDTRITDGDAPGKDAEAQKEERAGGEKNKGDADLDGFGNGLGSLGTHAAGPVPAADKPMDAKVPAEARPQSAPAASATPDAAAPSPPPPPTTATVPPLQPRGSAGAGADDISDLLRKGDNAKRKVIAVDEGPGWTPPAHHGPVGGRAMIPMRKAWDRKATFIAGNLMATQLASSISDLESAAKASPDSRDKTVALYQALMATGRIGEASELASKWSERDALDVDALVARADVAAMNGDREKSLRILSGLADIRPGDKAIQQRLVATFGEMNAPTLACQHRISLADIDPTDATAVASAALCSQNLRIWTVSSAQHDEVDPSQRDRVQSLMKTVKLDAPTVVGDVRLEAKWNTRADLDVALVDRNGHRLSVLGSSLKNVSMTCSNAAGATDETCGVNGLTSGNFVIEIARATPGTTPISGSVLLTLPGGGTQSVPFTLLGNRVEVGTMNVFFTSRLVPVDGSPGWGGWGAR